MSLHKSRSGNHKKQSGNEEERREQFISIISHQLRTPLSIVRGYLEALDSQELGQLNDQQKEYISEAAHINADMISLVNKYVETLNTNAKRLSPNIKKINVSETLRNMARHFQSYATASNIEMKVDVPKKDIQIDTDAQMLNSILETLIQNSLKYTIAAGTITLTGRDETDVVTITVQDTGVGIPRDQHSEVFKKFFRGKNVIHRSIAGSGLGLFVAKEYIDALGGTITFNSTEGKGTTMTLSFPHSTYER